MKHLQPRELIKINVLQNCLEDSRQMAETLAERTRSQVVQVIGRKIVLYREGKDDKKKIVLAKEIINGDILCLTAEKEVWNYGRHL